MGSSVSRKVRPAAVGDNWSPSPGRDEMKPYCPSQSSTRDSSPVIGPFCTYFAVFIGPTKSSK
jgi:hypothetical protein